LRSASARLDLSQKSQLIATTRPSSIGAIPRQLSTGGVVAMVAGLGLVTFELATRFINSRLGTGGHWIILFCGTAFSVWGLKEILAEWFPALGNRGVVRNRFHLPIEGRAYLVIMFFLLVGALVGRSNSLMLVFSMMAGPFVMNGWHTFTVLKRISVSRTLPPRAMVGEPFSVELTLENKKSWLAVWLMVIRDHVAGCGEFLAPEVLFVRCPAKGEQRGHYQLQLRRRGRYRFGPVHADTKFPLGLVERGLNLPTPGELLIYPWIGRLRSDWRRKLLQMSEQVNRNVVRGGAIQDEFHRIREYRHGDDPRTVHWRSTARRNELMVREFRENRDASLVVLVDAWSPNVGNVWDERLELALSFAATVCVDHLRQSRDAALVFGVQAKEVQIWQGGRVGGRLDDLLDLLATLTPNTGTTIRPLLEKVAPLIPTNAQILLLTPRPTTISNDWPADLHLPPMRVVESSRKQLEPLFDWLQSGA
jgi:uncharacterized protein (DUF58 family)